MKKHIFVLHVGDGGDLIQFVQDYFNISFKDALKKINYDFSLNLNFKEYSASELKQIEQQLKLNRLKKEQQEQAYRNKMLDLCNTSRILKNTREQIKSQMHPYNWEEIEFICSAISQQIELLDYEFDKLNRKDIDKNDFKMI